MDDVRLAEVVTAVGTLAAPMTQASDTHKSQFFSNDVCRQPRLPANKKTPQAWRRDTTAGNQPDVITASQKAAARKNIEAEKTAADRTPSITE
jgi:hypothetical protein